MDSIKPLFTATATASGGRNGHTEASDGTVKAEYLYRSFESQNYFAGIVPALPGGLASGTLNLNSVQVGVNYHF